MHPRFRTLAARARSCLALAWLLPVVAHAAEGVPAFDHVIVVVMENHAYDVARAQPYTAGLVATSASFSASYGTTHPSQPNYLALWAASTMGVTNDNCPSPGSPYTSENLGHAFEFAGLTWKAYSEALPAAGSAVCAAAANGYTRKHDPWTDWSNLDHANEVPFAQFALDTAARELPALAFVVPDNCHNTHDCAPAVGDAWLASQLPGMLRAAGPNGLVILTWDEDDYATGNHILTVFAGPRVLPGFVSPRPLTHYAVVRTITAAFGLDPFAGALAELPVTDVWKLPELSVPPSPGAELRLDAPAPDPSAGTVRATLHLGASVDVDAAVYDGSGRRVRALVTGVHGGTVTLAWDGCDARGRDAGSGVFFLRVRAGTQDVTRRVVRIR